MPGGGTSVVHRLWNPRLFLEDSLKNCSSGIFRSEMTHWSQNGSLGLLINPCCSIMFLLVISFRLRTRGCCWTGSGGSGRGACWAWSSLACLILYRCCMRQDSGLLSIDLEVANSCCPCLSCCLSFPCCWSLSLLVWRQP
jgi:hypothetical protein